MKDELVALVESTTEVSLSSGSSSRLLVGSLVAYLIDKGVVDQEEYLKHTVSMKEHLLANRKFSSETDKKILEASFDAHINDLQKSK
ncbi:hypothetical protein ACPC5U_13050 [Acinetobacter haemolyticus]|uniref:hypothetical protein n=1 Tax=Acinetobacter haemolyticus TaxID=29430 RepID=UPI003C1D6FEA